MHLVHSKANHFTTSSMWFVEDYKFVYNVSQSAPEYYNELNYDQRRGL